MSEFLIRKVTGAILGFKLGSKTPHDVTTAIEALRKVNPAMAEDYDKKFIAAAREKSKDPKEGK